MRIRPQKRLSAPRSRRDWLRAMRAKWLFDRESRTIMSWNSRFSAFSLFSLFSFASVFSIGSSGSILSIASNGSFLSIGSAGSILSIGSAGSILSIGAVGGILQKGRKRSTASSEEAVEAQPTLFR